MRGALRWAGIPALLLLALLAAAACGGYLYLRVSTAPQTEGTLGLEGLRGTVRVVREPSGVVHIRAANEHDLFFALGVAHAQDRLWQMEFQRRVGAGRLSEVLGRAALEQDRFLRTFGFYRAARSAYRSLGPEGRAAVDAYVAGVNAYLRTDPGLPLEFRLLGYEPEPWRPADVLVWAKMMSFDLSANYESELERYRLRARGVEPERIAELMPPYPEDGPVILPEGGEISPARERQAENLLRLRRSLPRSIEASNNWVVSGRRTESGSPLLANDPHLGLGVPALWYLAHLESPTLEAVGATLPGVPGVVIGRNRHIAWGVTNVGADVQDLYVLEEAEGGRGYRHGGEVLPYRMREERIRVKDAEDVVLRVRETVYGPVISGVVDAPGARPLALRWTSLEPEDGTIEAFLGINRARNWREFNEALRAYKAPSQNFVYADEEGNIGYVAPGKFPVRRKGHSGLEPVPGDGRWDWRGSVPFEEWPRAFNPREGFVVTANNKAVPDSYPHRIALEWAEPYRAERIRRMILSAGRLGVEDMVRIQQDRRSLLFEDFRPVLEELRVRDERARRWRERLLRWDGDARPDSREAAVFEAWYTELTRLPAREVGREYWDEPRYLLRAMRRGDTACEPSGSREDCLRFAARALGRGLERFGGEVPEWGGVHRAVFEHPVLSETPLAGFAGREVSAGGDGYTVNVGPYDPGSFRMDSGPSYRQVVDLAPEGRSFYVIPMGQSGSPLSGRFDDLLGLWGGGGYLRMRTAGYEADDTLILRPSR
ncbi:Penicillin acylase 2 proenzyme [Rubrobacter xylanophilus DSM 9941]|uniref:penicillin acylase family protein n=1 Tax=Rubrobacter xylanophilus TaxID=49319 RepID=UPI001C6438D9|nr:penicillin acylase family protein [Rubrobacter xylanophilus]QYJ15141.1 Penicillin acylase 2 proenzyme [Rubrobacter xylanophilus DSM 9941]